MRYAIDSKNKKILASEKGEKAKCPNCDSIVISKCGSFKINHWAHKSTFDCDSWNEPITQWHISWQDLFPEEFREVTLKQNNISHRADIRLKNGLVIEIQNSPIDINEIKKREDFYGKKNMIWILNGENLAKHSDIEYKYHRKEFSLSFQLYQNIQSYKKYDLDNMQLAIMETKLLKKLLKDKELIKFNVQNGYYFNFEFKTDKNFEDLRYELQKELNNCLGNLNIDVYEFLDRYEEEFPYEDLGFNIKYKRIKKGFFSHVYLNKKYWRKFIDHITYPVFIDNLNGLEEKYLFWYQKREIIKKENFINKYMQYT